MPFRNFMIKGLPYWLSNRWKAVLCWTNWNWMPIKKYAIVMGNEVKGVQQEVVNACDGCVEIPQYGTKHSLNVSVTTGIILWEFANKLMKFR